MNSKIVSFPKLSFCLNIRLVAILSGARNQKNVDLAEKYFHRIEFFFPNVELSRTAARILLANTFASTKNSSKATDLRNKIIQTGGKKVIGHSWTMIDGKIQVK